MMTARKLWLSLAILLIAAAFRLNQAAYGLENVCLTVPEEYWLYDAYQPVSLYRWNAAPPGALDSLAGRIQPAPLITPSTAALDRFFLRLVSLAAGLITLAVLIRLGRGFGAGWWWLAGLLAAAAPWLVAADRWTVRFDLAPLVVAVSLLALWRSKRLPEGWQREAAIGVQLLTALSLLVIAPPLWWLAVALVLIQPYPRWRWVAFVALSGFVLIPGLQTPELWLAAAGAWDVSITAALFVAGLVFVLWWRRSLPLAQQTALIVVVLAGGLTVYADSQHATPSPVEWQLIDWLQTRIPDDAVVRFDGATWELADATACPLGADIRFEAQSPPVEFFDVRALSTPDYFVSTNPDDVAQMPFVSQIAEQYWVGRSLELAQPVDIAFGDLVSLLSYEVLTPVVQPSGMVDIRIDYQFGANITADVLAYAAFVHVTPTDDPTTNWANFSDPFFGESGNTGSRRVMVNHHIRFPLPAEIPAGVYAVRYGIFNQYTGENVGAPVLLGEIRVE